MKVISEQNPWGFLLCIGLKDIENRTWPLPEKYKGETILIHASAKSAGKIMDLLNKEQQAALWWHLLCNREYDCKEEDLACGAIIGSVRFVDCVEDHPSIWAEDWKVNIPWHNGVWGGTKDIKYYNWVTTDAVMFEKPILNVKGRLGFWDYPMTEEEYNNLAKIGL